MKVQILLMQLLLATGVCAQLNTEDIQLIVKKSGSGIELQNLEQVKEFYAINGYNYAWVNHASNTKTLLQLLQTAPELGLEVADYQFDFVQSFRYNLVIPSTHRDTLYTETRLTDAAIHFFSDVAYGNRKPVLGYDGLDHTPDCFSIPALLSKAVAANRLSQFVKDLEPDCAGYGTLKDWLALFIQSVNDSLYKETKITSGNVNSGNQPLMNKLYYLGIIDSLNKKYPDAVIKLKLRSAQRLFNILDDGVLRKTTIDVLNTPFSIRMEELKSAMNTIRWLRCVSAQSPVFVVNIPSATLLIIKNGQALLESKVIVGKRSTPTPTLASTITEVVLYPYWMVPDKIATRELLPLIKRNPGYLEANSMQVLNQSGKIVNPYTIDWNRLSPSYFPYTIRQSTGCDNSLGIVKFNFYSPYSVYLHDTPWKVLFNFNKRYFSHGCMRVEKAIELAHFLLKENSIAIDTLVEKGCLNDQPPITIPVTGRIPVFVLYNTAWFDSTGVVQFQDDIYRKVNFNQKRLPL